MKIIIGAAFMSAVGTLVATSGYLMGVPVHGPDCAELCSFDMYWLGALAGYIILPKQRALKQ